MTKAFVLSDVETLKNNLVNGAIQRGYYNEQKLALYCGMCDTIYKAVARNNKALIKSIDIGLISNPVTLRIVGNAHYWAHTSSR
jgi:hypothetical protein